MNWTYTTATNMVSSSHATASNKTRTNVISPAWDVLFMAVVASCRTYLYHRIPPSHFLSVIRNQPRTDSSVYFPVHGQQPEETEPVRNGRRVTELPPSPRSGRAVYPLRRYQRCKEKKHSDPEIIQTSGSEYLWQHHL